MLTASTWPEILRRYLLTTRADQEPPAEDACPLSLDNDQVALLAARKLETTAWHQLERPSLGKMGRGRGSALGESLEQVLCARPCIPHVPHGHVT